MRLASRLGQIRSEVKAFVDDRLTVSHIRASLAHALDTVFPPHRFDTTEDAPPEALMGAGLASANWSRVRFLDHDGCDMCACPFEGGLFLGVGAHCSDCTDKPFPFRRARAACVYDDSVSGLILGFKNGDRLDLAPMLTRWLERAGTGATLRACADTLLKAGAASVDVCVLARAVKH